MFFFFSFSPSLLENPIDDKVQAESVDGTARDWSEINCLKSQDAFPVSEKPFQTALLWKDQF